MDLRVARRTVVYGLGTGVFTLLAVGIPSVIIPNPLFARMTPVRPQDVVILAITVVLAAMLGATYALPVSCPLETGRATVGGVLSLLAVGCPVCNKVVLLLLGTGGAMTLFEPIQPLIGMVGIVLLASGLVLRLRQVRIAMVTSNG